MEVRDSSRSFKLKKSKTFVQFATLGEPYFIEPNIGVGLVGTYNTADGKGRIYNLTTGTVITEVPSGYPAGKQVRNVVRFGTDFDSKQRDCLLLTKGGIHRFNESAPDTSLVLDEVVFTPTFTLGAVNSEEVPFYVESTQKLFVGFNNVIYTVGPNGILPDTTEIVLNTDERIKKITKIGDQYIIYASTVRDSAVYYWDGQSRLPTRSVRWPDFVVKNVQTIGPFNYVWGVSGNESLLYKSDGYSKQELAHGLTTSPESRMSFSQGSGNATEAIKDTVLIPAKRTIYRFGTTTPGMPESLTREYSFGSVNTDLCYSMAVSGNNLYIGYETTSGNGVVETKRIIGDASDRVDTGYIEEAPFIGDLASIKKALHRVRVFGNFSGAVQLYAKRDDGAYELLLTATAADW